MFKRSFLKKLSFLLLFSLAFSLISILPEEPAYASGEFACVDSNGAPYAYHMEFSGDDVTVYQWDVTNGEYNHYRSKGPLSNEETEYLNNYISTCIGN